MNWTNRFCTLVVARLSSSYTKELWATTSIENCEEQLLSYLLRRASWLLESRKTWLNFSPGKVRPFRQRNQRCPSNSVWKRDAPCHPKPSLAKPPFPIFFFCSVYLVLIVRMFRFFSAAFCCFQCFTACPGLIHMFRIFSMD